MIRIPNKREEIVITEHPFTARRTIRYNAAANAKRAIEQQFPDLFTDLPKSDSNSGGLVSPEVKSNATSI